MLFDTHVHSKISSDAKNSIIDMCNAAVLKGVSVICFTEHFDLNPDDTNYGFYNHDEYTSEIDQARSLFSDKLEILQGIEFSEPHKYPRQFELMMKKNFDFILGSLHWIGDTWAGAEDILARYSMDEVHRMHYSETLKLARFGGFDSLAHIDFPRRYLKNFPEPDELIDEIVTTLIRSNISLELNSSPLRKGNDFAFPSQAILHRYGHFGGKTVTIGSDAHSTDDIGSGYEYMLNQAASFQLEPVLYRLRKPYKLAGHE